MTDLQVEVAGLKLRNPLMNASGVFGTTASLLRRVASAGAGAVISKSATYEPREGYENPTYVELKCGAINSMGLPNPGYMEMAEELDSLVDLGVPVIASIAPEDENQASAMARRMAKVAHALELNLSCPHAEMLGYDLSSDLDLAKRVVREAKASCLRPVFVKLPPIRADCLSLVKELGSADGFVVSNTVRAMAIDISARRPVLSNKFGGLSGAPIHPVVVGLTYELYEMTDKPIMGAGGVTDWADAVELMLAGATAVQIGSALSEGLQLFDSIKKGMTDYLDELGIPAKQLVGLAHKA